MFQKVDDLNAMLTKQEELDSELVGHIRVGSIGVMLHHKFVIYPFYAEPFNAFINAQYRHKVEAVKNAIIDGKYHSYVWLHERPYRFEAFAEIMDLLDNKTYWDLLGDIYTDSENVSQCWEDVKPMFENTRNGRMSIMNKDELAKLKELGEEVIIYRGFCVKPGQNNKDAWKNNYSFTIDRNTAIWFANRFKGMGGVGKSKLVTAKCKKTDIIAMFTRRGESEVLIDPLKLYDVVVKAV